MNFREWFEDQSNQIEGFAVYQNMIEIPEGELRKEYREEIQPELENQTSDSSAYLRWQLSPEEARQIFGDEEHFLSIAKAAKPQVLPPSVLKTVHNYSQVEEIIKAAEQGQGRFGVLRNQARFFRGVDAAMQQSQFQQGVRPSSAELQRMQAGGYGKYSSFRHKFDMLQENKPVAYPLLLYHNGQYCHVSGHTRQTAAVSKRMILPVKVIEA
jgi:hypothetical protein